MVSYSRPEHLVCEAGCRLCPNSLLMVNSSEKTCPAILPKKYADGTSSDLSSCKCDPKQSVSYRSKLDPILGPIP